MSVSSVSLNTDVNVRYEKLASEYGKLRAQAKVLREGVLDERGKNDILKEDLKNKDTDIRKLRSENESLVFRNEQLSRRVEALQNEAEIHVKQAPKGSKKSKDSISQDVLSQLKLMTDRVAVLEEELANKLSQNEMLSRKVIEIENIHIEEMAAQSEKFRTEITKLDKALQDALTDNIKNKKTRPIEPVRPLYIHTEEDKVKTEVPIIAPKNITTESIIEVDDVSDVYLQGIELSQLIMQNFSSLLHLLSQRYTLYPFDSSLEHLPSNISSLSSEFSEKCVLINNTVQILEDIVNRGSVDWVVDSSSLCLSFNAFIATWNDNSFTALQELSREESKTPYANKVLEELNSKWCGGLASLIKSLSGFTESMSTHNLENISEHLIEVVNIFHEIEKIFTQRWQIEARFPTSTRRLHCICEAIVDCLKKISAEASKLSSRVYALAHNRISQSPLNLTESVEQEKELQITVDDTPMVNCVESVCSPANISEVSGAVSINNLVSPPISEPVKEDVLIITNLNARVAELELEREKHLVDLSLLRRKLANLQSSGAETQDSTKIISEAEHVKEFGKSRLRCLMDERQQAESKALHFNKECAILLRKMKSLREVNSRLERKTTELIKQNEKLDDELTSVRHGYESQLSSLSEHIAELNAKEKLKEQKVQDPPPQPSRGLKSLFK